MLAGAVSVIGIVLLARGVIGADLVATFTVFARGVMIHRGRVPDRGRRFRRFRERNELIRDEAQSLAAALRYEEKRNQQGDQHGSCGREPPNHSDDACR